MRPIHDLVERAQKIVLDAFPKRFVYIDRAAHRCSRLCSEHTEMSYLEKVVEVSLHRLPTLNELPIQAPYFFVDPPVPSKDLMSTDSAAHALEVAEGAVRRFSEVSNDHWERDTLASVLKCLPKDENLGKSTAVMAAIRITLTGMKVYSSLLCTPWRH